MVFARIKLWLAAAGGVILLIGAAFLSGWTKRGLKAKQDAVEDYVNTRRRIDDADIPADPDGARQWLRDRRSGGDL
jgi:hypothetical protein